MNEIDELLVQEAKVDLHHYTGVQGLYGIAKSRQLWASSAYYLNDSSEIVDAVALVKQIALANTSNVSSSEKEVLLQLASWLDFLKSPQGIYVFSLSERENDLNQWRAYTPYGKGAAFSFCPPQIKAIADLNSCKLIKCIYDSEQKESVARRVVDKTLETWRTCGELRPAHPTQKYHPLFERLKANFLLVFSSFKDQRFQAEEEWRLVSQASSFVDIPVDYRTGASMLIPYRQLEFPEDQPLFDRIWVGPTEHGNLSMHAMSAFMSKYRLVRSGCLNSMIPYREWR